MSDCFDLLPRLPIPVLRTPQLARSVAWYRAVLGFTPAQVVPGVVALLRLGPVQLQLWQTPEAAPHGCHIPLDGLGASVFECHSRMARAARAWIANAPVLKPWGSWEFALTDGDGNHLLFTQGATALPTQPQPHLPDGDGRWRWP